MRFYVNRFGSNAANQSMNPGPVRIAEVEANSESEACRLAAERVTVYNNQFLTAEDAEAVDSREADIDDAVTVLG